jgi:hypothetical protein
LTGCGSEPQEQVEETGTLSVALVYFAGDGAAYSFQPGTSLAIGNGRFFEQIPLDTSDPFVNRTVPVGTLNAQFLPSTPVQLVKTLGGQTTLVNATLLNPQPIQVTINEGQLSPLALSFRVNGVGDVVFDVGQLQIILQVERMNVATAAEIHESGATSVASVSFGPTATPEAQSLLAVDVGETVNVSTVFEANGDWYLQSSFVACVSGQLVTITLPATTPPGFVARMAEVIGGTGDYCIVDQGVGGGNDNTNLLVRSTVIPPEQQAALPDFAEAELFIAGILPTEVFDGTAFTQSSLEIPQALTNGFFRHTVQSFTSVVTTLQGDFTGQVQVVP